MNLCKNNGWNFTVLSVITFGLSLNVTEIYCQGCGSTLETEGTFGVNCSEMCTCATTAVCDNITGQCSGSLCGNEKAIFACDKNDLKVVVIPSNQIVMGPTSFVVTCIVNLTPEDVTVSWRNPTGTIVTPGLKYGILRTSGTVYNLTVRNSGPEDSGLYTCIATLHQPTVDLTSVEESKSILVVAHGKIFEFPKTVVKNLPGENLQLICKAFFGLGAQSSLQWTWSERAIDFSQTLQLIEKLEFFGTTDVFKTRTLEFSNLTTSRSGTYTCSASENGSDESDRKEVNVLIVEPAEISDLHLSSKTHSSLHFTWTLVNRGGDDILCTATYCLGEECSLTNCTSEDACNITDLSSCSTYNISVLCDNFSGSSNELQFFNAKTTASGPSTPTNPEITDSPSYCNISWGEPMKTNGPGIYYQIRRLVARRDTLEVQEQSYSERVDDTKFSAQKNKLAPNSVYSFEICAGNDYHLGGCLRVNGTCVTDYDVPDSVPDLKLAMVTDKVTSSSFTILAPSVEDRNGPISCYEFVITENEAADVRIDPDRDYPFSSIQDKPLNKSLPYRAIVLTHQKLQETPTVTMGGDEDLSSVCNLSTTSSRKKRNGQLSSGVSILRASNEALKADTDYKLFMRVYVGLENGTSIYVSSGYLEVTTSRSGSIVLTIIIILALTVVTAVSVLIWITRRRHWVQKKTIMHLEDGGLNGSYVNQGFVAGASSYLSLQSVKSTENQPNSSYLSLKPAVTSVTGIQLSSRSLEIPSQQSVKESDYYSQDNQYMEMKGNIQKLSSEDESVKISNLVASVDRRGEGEEHSSGTREPRDNAIENMDPGVNGREAIQEEEDYEEIPHEENDDYSRALYEKLQAPVPFKVSELSEYIERRKGYGPKSLENEFGILPKGQQEPWTEAIKEENSSKNTFPSILPYDHTRVKLAKLPNDAASDYYNASYITVRPFKSLVGPGSCYSDDSSLDQFNKTAFIAAQGPNSSTVEDFWRMVWQEKVEVITMVTNLEGEEKQLCVKYWPDSIGVKVEFGGISVEVKSIESFADFQVRNIQIQKESEPSVAVKQFHYLCWPYMKVPIKTSSLLSFVKQVKEAQKSIKAPPLVHCSDGAGATGTFLALYCLLDDLSAGNEISVYDFVKKMRKSRVNMVQTKTQYLYLYNALLEAHLTPQAEITAEILDEMEITSDLFLEELQVLKQLASSSKTKRKGDLEENKTKNRFPDIIPADQLRPVLSSESLMSGNDYVNASFANSFLKTKAYILTQSPLPTTVEDFWRLVFDFHCRKIVALNSIDGSDKTLPYYWPRGGVVQYGSMTIESIGMETFDGFILRKFSVSHVDKTDALSVTQIHLSSWKADDPSKLGDFFRTATDCEEGPTVVHCIDGCSDSAVFVTVKCEMQRFRLTGKIDVFNRVRELATANPYIVPKVEDYTLCYKILKYMVKAEEIDNQRASDSNLEDMSTVDEECQGIL